MTPIEPVRSLRHAMLGMLAGLLTLGACAARDPGLGPARAALEEHAGLNTRWTLPDESAGPEIGLLLSRPLTADDAVQIALLNNADLQRALEALGVARGALVDASRPPNLRLDGGIADGRGGAPNEWGFAVTTELSRLFLLPLERGMAQAALDATRFETAGSVLGFVHGVRSAYYEYQTARQLYELAETVLEAATASHEFARRLYEAGNISPLELAHERAFYEEARSGAALREAAALHRREELNVWMGLAGAETEWEPAGRLEPPTVAAPGLESLERQAIEHSLDLAELEHRYTEAARGANLARAEGLLPSLRGGVETSREEGLAATGAVFAVELPIFNQGQGRVETARARMRQIEHLHRARAVEIRAAARTVRNMLLVAARRVEHFQNVLLPLREEIVNQTQLHYNAMQVDVFQLLAARREQVRTGEEYVAALADYWQARNTVDQIAAGRLVPVADVTLRGRSF